MANGNPISLESMFWEQFDPSKSLIKETKQTLVQIEPVLLKAIPASSWCPSRADGDRRSLCGPAPWGQGGTDPSERQGGLGGAGRVAPQGCPILCRRTRAVSAGTSASTPGESHGPLHPP